MHHMVFDFGLFSYLIGWLGFSSSDDPAGGALNTTTVRPIGG
jgi:hypothetical protein